MRALSPTFALAPLLVMMMAAAGPLRAAEDESEKDEAETKTKTEKPEPVPAASVTKHQIALDGKTVKYTATAGWYILKDKDDEPIARFGYTAYTLDGIKDRSRRPVTFAFNGGPGSSSIWLHMGIMGPRRAVVNDPGYASPPPAQIVDNAYSPLDVTDVVMIDPVGTGFSKPLGEAKPEDFHGVDEDIRSVAQFIKRYVSENGRWGSPKYVLGESYGGMRGAGLAYHLQAEQGMNLNGLVIVSPFLNAETGIDGAGIDSAHVAYFPTLAATAWYHGLVQDKPPTIEQYMADVERFAREEYLPALAKGYVLPEADKKAVAAKLARYTGTTADYWERADLRVTHTQFLQELKRGDRLIAGRIDSRYIGPSVNPLAAEMDYDPFFPAIGPAYTSAFLSYLHHELEFGRDEEYQVSAFDIEWSWEHEQPGNTGWMSPVPNTVPDLALAMTMNPGLHLLVQQGWYDLATPFLAMKIDLEHLDVTPEARNRIHVKYYDAGHMMYVHGPSMQKFRDDLVGFIRDTDRL
ncbi:MAG: Carboxypeptidase [Steroidobacteraceae bacterium]|nr:Carboxypeptidase [Steroidobacteraceae bacterium]